MKTLDELNGYDKAAIIFDILGDSLSINMFKDIPEAEFYKLRDHALALDQVDNEKRMTFLSKVNPEKQNKIVLQTGNLADIPLEAIIHTAKELKKKSAFLPGPVEFSRGGGQSVSDMLSKMPEDDAKKYLEQMKTDSPDLLNDVKKYFLLFEDILQMPEKIAASFWADPEIELEVMATALAEYNTETVGKFARILAREKASYVYTKN